jgi:antitoxin YefM
MEIISYTKARNNFSDVMNQVCENHIPITIYRQESKPVVLMSLEDYNSIEETMYLLSTPNNTKQLYDAIDDLKNDKNFIKVDI